MTGSYVGSELELFEAAVTWKSYVRDQIAPHLGPVVIEVGAGIGSTTRALITGRHERWTCLEPDPEMAARIERSVAEGTLPAFCEAATGTLSGHETAAEPVDAILYIDVLEHIENDAEEVRLASRLLRPGGRLVVLAPAHQWLYSPFDEAIGHHRRYSRSSLSALTCEGLRLTTLRSLDAIGLLASAGNRFLLRDAHPTAAQIRIWDRVLVRASRVVDPVLGYRLGKSVLAVWEREGE